MSDEQRVRTMAGWIGVEISRSRVRTPGRPGYGLYRVRGSEGMCWHDAQQLPRAQRTEDLHGRRGAWTAYAFTLDEIERAVRVAIDAGTPECPGKMIVDHPHQRPESSWLALPVPTRWTQAYRGRRDLGMVGGEPSRVCGQPYRHEDGCRCLAGEEPQWLPDDEPTPVEVRPEFAAEVSALMPLVDAGLVEIRHVEGCLCDDGRYTAACLRASMTGRQRQRANNAEFQKEHLERRTYGLAERHRRKLDRRGRNAASQNPAGGGPHLPADGLEGPVG